MTILMMTLFRPVMPTRSVGAFALALAASILGVQQSVSAQSSLEQIPASGSDIAAELGLQMSKFKARFAEPVYSLVRVQVQPVKGNGSYFEVHVRSPSPLRITEILFSMKDLQFVKRQLGLLDEKILLEESEEDPGAEADGHEFGESPNSLMSFFVKSQLFDGRHYALNPFGTAEPGTSFLTWSPQHSTEDLPLDREIPLFIKAGPYSGEDATKVADIMQEYVLARAYVRVTVKFSKNLILTDAEKEAEKKRKASLEAALSRIDEIVGADGADGADSGNDTEPVSVGDE